MRNLTLEENDLTQEADPETVRLVEQTVIESKAYETKKQLWGRMRGQVDRDLFEQAISQLKQNGKIMLDGPFVIYTGIDNTRLKALAASSAPL